VLSEDALQSEFNQAGSLSTSLHTEVGIDGLSKFGVLLVVGLSKALKRLNPKSEK
jgi:hypothetical protein